MKKRILTKKSLNYIPLGFAIPFLWMLTFMILGKAFPFGDESLLYSDGYHQYYPFFKEFHRALLSGDSILYSWNVGMGIDYLGLISYYVASPLNLLSILIPEEGLLHYFSLLFPIRIALAGLFFSIFLNRVFKRKDLSVPLFGTFYALCAWSLGYQWNVMWLDTFALLPLVALGTYKLLSEKSFILYTITLFLSIFSNYYIGFFTCIFVLITFICYEICRWNGFKKFIFDLLRIALFSALAIGMSAILELPTLAALKTTQSSVNQFPKDFRLNIVDAELYKQIVADNYALAKSAWASNNKLESIPYIWTATKTAFVALFNGMKQVAGNTTFGTTINFKEADALPNLYCGVITLFFSSLFLTCKQIKVRDKICSVLFLVFLIVSFLIRQLDYIWHGFHFTNMIPYRFSFIFSFVMLYMGYKAYTIKHRIKPWQICVASVISCIPIFISNNFAESIETIFSENYINSLSIAVNSVELSIDWLKTLYQCFRPLLYPLSNILLILGTALLLLVGTAKCGYQKQKTFADKKKYVVNYRKRYQLATIALLLLCVIETALNMCNYFRFWNGASVSNYPKGTNDSKAVFAQLPDTEQFYRTETSHAQTLNDGALNGYNGISTFTSSANVGITKFMQNLGYGAKNTYNRYCYESSSPVADLFLNIKYVVDRDGFYYEGPISRTNSETKEKYIAQKEAYSNPYYDVIYQETLVALTENNAYLPLGFLCEESLDQFDFTENENQFAFEEKLIEAATDQKFDLWHPISNRQLMINGDENVTVNPTDNPAECKFTANQSGTITYEFVSDRSGLFCIDVYQSKRYGFSVWLNNNHDALPDERIYTESYSLPQFLSVCAVEPGDIVEIRFDCKAGDTGRIKVQGAVLDESEFRAAHEILSKSTYNISSFSNTRIEGTIDCHKDGLMYTSIPQNGENWKAYVDGEPAEIVLIGDVMISLQLTEGTHNITFQYENKAFKIGSIVSLVCLVIFISISIFVYRSKIKNCCSKIIENKKSLRTSQKGRYDKT